MRHHVSDGVIKTHGAEVHTANRHHTSRSTRACAQMSMMRLDIECMLDTQFSQDAARRRCTYLRTTTQSSHRAREGTPPTASTTSMVAATRMVNSALPLRGAGTAHHFLSIVEICEEPHRREVQ